MPPDANELGDAVRGIDVVVDDQDAARHELVGQRVVADGGRGWLRGRAQKRQVDDEFAALARAPADRPDVAAVRLDDLPHQGQPDAESAFGPGARGVRLHEQVEHVRQDGGGDSSTVISHGHHGLVIFGGQAQRDVAAPTARLISEQRDRWHDRYNASCRS